MALEEFWCARLTCDTVLCDQRTVAHFYSPDGNYTADETRHEASKVGWAADGSKDYCPDCSRVRRLP